MLTVRVKRHLYACDLHHLTLISRMWDVGCMPGGDAHIHISDLRNLEVTSSSDLTLKAYHVPGHLTGIAVVRVRIFNLRWIIAESPSWTQQVQTTDSNLYFILNVQASQGFLLIIRPFLDSPACWIQINLLWCHKYGDSDACPCMQCFSTLFW